MSTSLLLTRAAESWRIEGPKGFGKLAVKYVMMLAGPS